MRAVVNIKGHPIHPMLIAFPIGIIGHSVRIRYSRHSAHQQSALGSRFLRNNCRMCWGRARHRCRSGRPASGRYLPVRRQETRIPTRRAQRGGTASLRLRGLAARRSVGRARRCCPAYFRSLWFYWASRDVLGGTLVYRNQIGVDRRYAMPKTKAAHACMRSEKPVCNQSELSDGQLMLASVGNERVAVARCGEGIFAFSDHCTHRGGPLSDGALIGCVVQCPWHGSQFDVTTGRVVAGPAEEKIKLYDVELRNGEVYVQARRPKDRRKRRRNIDNL